MSKKIVGVTVGTPTSPKVLERKLKPVKTVNGVVPDENGNAQVTAEQVGARPDNWMPSASDVGASPMEYTKKVGNPHNLLDNSDFRNPVNQRNVTSYVSGQYGIDRWVCDLVGFTATVQSDGIHLQGSEGGFWWKQPVLVGGAVKIGAKLTIAVKKKNAEPIVAVLTVPASGTDNSISPMAGNVLQLTTTSDGSQVIFVYFGNNANEEYVIEWAALYEGEYTAETLPEYQPKGYEAELLICKQYDPTTGEYIGLTPAFVGAAPAGYGLGSSTINGMSVSTRAEIDSFLCNGWIGYQNHTPTPLISDALNSFMAIVFADSINSNFGKQTAIDFDGYVHKRDRIWGEWKPWEWENPPMIPGVEYRTTERWTTEDDRTVPIYTKKINYGNVGAGYSSLSTGCGTRVVRSAVTHGGGVVPFDGVGASNNSYSKVVGIDNVNLHFFGGTNAGTANLSAQLWYIKD